MDDIRCILKEANGIKGERCEGVDCIYWRALSHLGQPIGNGCAIEHSDVLGDANLVKWLLTVKERLVSTGLAVKGEDGIAVRDNEQG
jgi:hypothetical protein